MNISKKQLIITGLFVSLFALGIWFYFPSKKVDAKREVYFPEVTVIKDEKKIEALLKEHKIVVLFVHMKRCGPCKRLAPKINQLASENQREGVFFAKIDREEASKLCEKYGIKMFPTVLIFKEGERKKQFEGCSQSPVEFFANEIDALLDS
jgi:thioredoxin 1